MTAYVLIAMALVVIFMIFYLANLASIENYEETAVKCNKQAQECNKLMGGYNILSQHCGGESIYLNLTYVPMEVENDG